MSSGFWPSFVHTKSRVSQKIVDDMEPNEFFGGTIFRIDKLENAFRLHRRIRIACEPWL